jgi:hypothetical protein
MLKSFKFGAEDVDLPYRKGLGATAYDVSIDETSGAGGNPPGQAVR